MVKRGKRWSCSRSAAAIGSTRETVNKTLADFEKRGLIKVERRRVHVLDQEALRREVRI